MRTSWLAGPSDTDLAQSPGLLDALSTTITESQSRVEKLLPASKGEVGSLRTDNNILSTEISQLKPIVNLLVNK
jgi:hypothetical protein